MKCYRLNCKEECNEIKINYCIMKITKEQQDLIARIKSNKYCEICGEKKIGAHYKGLSIKLCTRCGVRGQIA